jgi:hypothetical protein
MLIELNQIAERSQRFLTFFHRFGDRNQRLRFRLGAGVRVVLPRSIVRAAVRFAADMRRSNAATSRCGSGRS